VRVQTGKETVELIKKFVSRPISKEEVKHLENVYKYDLDIHIPFNCLIGKVESLLCISIEPDPHGDESGSCSHTHVTLICQKMKIGDSPESDCCGVTGEPCQFDVGQHLDTNIQKKIFSLEIIQNCAMIEHYGSICINHLLETKKIERNLDFYHLGLFLFVAHLIDKDTYDKIEKIRKIRNKLAHRIDAYKLLSNINLKEHMQLSKDISCLIMNVSIKLQYKLKKNNGELHG